MRRSSPVGRRWRAAMVATVALVSLLPATPSAGAPSAAGAPAPVDASVREAVAAAGKARFWVVLDERADLAAASRVAGWAARGEAVVGALRATADRSQAGVLAELARRGAPAEAFWVVNAVLVTGDAATVDAMAARPDVAAVRAPRTYELPEPRAGVDQPTVDGVEWGVASINADDVWSTFGVRGEGIVVANIDTGVDAGHPALAAAYRGNLGSGVLDHDHSWFDPSGVCPRPAPCDNNGHGTHTMGTMVGSAGLNQVGVAPGARWIAAKGCESTSCSDRALLASGQWALAPTDVHGNDPRPELRPNVVNSSWGNGDGGDPFYRETVAAWVAAGIFPSFSNGNAGPSCRTVGAPASYPESYGVGAYDARNRIAGFSSRGPSPVGGETKPDIAAPGVDVRSSVPGGYASLDGTSMAAPHVSGAVALMWSAAPALVGDVATTRELLDQTAVDTAADQCGGTAADNAVWGEGRLDALAAVTQSPRGPSGRLDGVVIDGGDESPVPGASVRAVGGEIDRTTLAGGDGMFSLTLPVGRYEVTVSAFRYETRTLRVEVRRNQGIAVEVVLRPLPTHTVDGRVVDPLGRPVAGAAVALGATPLSAVTTADGRFRFLRVPEGRYLLTTEPGGCYEPRRQRVEVDGPERVRVLTEALVDAGGYGCQVVDRVPIETTNVLPLTGDDVARPVDLPFAFTLYGVAYSRVVVGTNGLLNFRGDDNPYTNTPIPTAARPNGAVYGFWDDLVIDGGADVLTRRLGSAPDRRFVIEWRNAAFYDDAGRVTVQVVLGEDGTATVQWSGIGAADRERGGSATVGVENGNGTIALQYSSDEAVLASGLAIRFSPPAG